MIKWQEFRRERKGKAALIWKIRQDGASLFTSSGVENGAFQEFSDTPGSKGKEGSKSFVNAIDNCTWSISREVRYKTEEGYILYIDGKPTEEAITSLDFSKTLPKQFTSSKPCTDITPEALEKLFKSGNTKFTRKYDGNCLICVFEKTGWQIYSRRADLITDRFPLHIEQLNNSPFEVGTIITGEMICQNPNGTDNFKNISRICRSDPETARKLIADKEVPEPLFLMFDIIFHNGTDLSNTKYKDRRKLYEGFSTDLIKPVEYHNVNPSNWQETAIKNGWEGFVVVDVESIPGDKFYNFSGTAKRWRGSHKLKPTRTDDFVLYAAVQGTGKRLKGIGAIFIAQKHPDTKEWFPCGKCGSGFTDESLDELEKLCAKMGIPVLGGELTQKAIDTELSKIDIDNDSTLVVELEYNERQPGTNKLKFPVFMRIRNDKDKQECFAQMLAPEDE